MPRCSAGTIPGSLETAGPMGEGPGSSAPLELETLCMWKPTDATYVPTALKASLTEQLKEKWLKLV